MILVETGATSATCGWEIPSKLSIDKVPWAQEEQWECTDDFFASDGFLSATRPHHPRSWHQGDDQSDLLPGPSHACNRPTPRSS
jgi:hypothetical protein